MLMHLFSMSNYEEYRKSLKGRRILFLLATFMGVAAIAISTMAMLTDPNANGLAMGFITGNGTAFTAIGLMGIWSTRRTLRDEKRLRASFIGETDERKQEISRRASSLTTLVSLFVLYAALLVSALLDRTVFNTLSVVFYVYIIIFFGCLFYFNKKL